MDRPGKLAKQIKLPNPCEGDEGTGVQDKDHPVGPFLSRRAWRSR
jgi:hypothetical protein